MAAPYDLDSRRGFQCELPPNGAKGPPLETWFPWPFDVEVE
jgi:hypothetical protein